MMENCFNFDKIENFLLNSASLEYLENVKNTNFCIVSAFSGVSLLKYKSMITNRTPHVAAILAHMLKTFKDRKVVKDFNDIRLVAFSAGCHLAGMVGRILHEKTNEKVGDIFGNPIHRLKT